MIVFYSYLGVDSFVFIVGNCVSERSGWIESGKQRGARPHRVLRISDNFLKLSYGPLSANELTSHAGRLPPGSASNV